MFDLAFGGVQVGQQGAKRQEPNNEDQLLRSERPWNDLPEPKRAEAELYVRAPLHRMVGLLKLRCIERVRCEVAYVRLHLFLRLSRYTGYLARVEKVGRARESAQ